MSIKEIPDIAVTVRMTCLNPECEESFRDRVVNFDYEDRYAGTFKPVNNVKIQTSKSVETYIKCDRCNKVYNLFIEVY